MEPLPQQCNDWWDGPFKYISRLDVAANGTNNTQNHPP